MIKGICFDLDQTLCNSEDFILSTKSQKCQVKESETAEYKVFEYLQNFLKIVSWEKFYRVYSLSKSEIKKNLGHIAASHNRYLYIQRTLENLGTCFNPSLVLEATSLYWRHVIKQMNLFPNVLNILKQLKRYHYKTCIISDLTADIQIKKLIKLNISKYIDYLITSEEAGTDKPLPNQLKLALNKLGLDKDEVIIVGNNPKTDIELARRNRITSVLYDHHGDHKRKRHCADFYITDFSKLSNIINIKKKKYLKDKLIIFDLIGTISLTRHLVSIVLEKLLKKSPEEIRPVYEKYKVGKISQKEFWQAMNITDFMEIENDLINSIKPRELMFKILKNLSKKHHLVVLSNIPKEWGYALVKSYKLDRFFEKFYFSGELKLKKPNPEIYKVVANDYKNINPENVYFVDDELGDLAASKFLLMQTIWFKQDKQDASYIPDFVIHHERDLLNIL